MTALKPIENRKVIGVASETYPTNKVCAHPECTSPAESVHHAFPRSQTKSKSYFVQINDSQEGEVWSGQIIPHAVGLCGSGTTGHHGDLEEHRAWLKLEDDVWVWYDRNKDWDDPETVNGSTDEWQFIGKLNPQPGSQDGKTKRGPNKKTTGKARAKHCYTLNVPKDEQENGVEVLETLIASCRDEWKDEMGWSENVPDYYPVVAALTKALQ